jgi:hypothetical protein
MMTNMSSRGNSAVSLASVWKSVVIVVLFVAVHYWLGRVCHVSKRHVGELDVVFAFVQILYE